MRSWWGFLDRRFNREDYEATSRLVHNSNPYWTWHVGPIELFSTQSCTSSLRLVLHMLGFGTKTQRTRVSPTLRFRKKLPILIQTGEQQKQSQMDSREKTFVECCVRVDLTNWQIRLNYVIFMLWHYWLYISGIRRWTDSFISEH